MIFNMMENNITYKLGTTMKFYYFSIDLHRKSEFVAWRLRISDATHIRANVQFHLCCNHENISRNVLYCWRLYDHASSRRVLVSLSGCDAPLEAIVSIFFISIEY